MLEYSQLTNVIVSGDQGRDSAVYIHDPFSPKPVRESISRQVDKKTGVPKQEKGVWGSQGGGKDKWFFVFVFFFLFSLSTFLSLSRIKYCFSLSPELMIRQQITQFKL